MDTFTPNLQAEKAGEPYTGSATFTANYQSNGIVLFVGHPLQDMLPITDRFSCIMAENVEEGAKVTRYLYHIAKQIPAVIIYRFDNNLENAFAEWETFFSTHPFLCTTPFFIYADKCFAFDTIRLLVAKYPFIDDAITSDAWPMLGNKAAIVNKYKSMRNFPLYKHTPVVKPEYTKISLGNFFKRLVDVLLAVTGLIILSPLMLLIAILIKLESKGPVFYAAMRAGRNFRIFKFYKFRTMIPEADKQLPELSHLNQYEDNTTAPVFYKVANDPRVTKLGTFLRNSSLDEIPQLFNVLKGDMSLVGNRPLPLYEASALTTDNWVERFLAPAGITGLWQVRKRGKKEMSVKERIDLDIDYAHMHSFKYDLWLMVNTPRALVQKDNV